jgi:glycosyltransferase involved in cell wall biosynthesis
MTNRLKVLISAYACEPGKGSEPEVGWQWCMQMARFHDVTVVTRENNRATIVVALAAMPSGQAVPRFVYFDGPSPLLRLKARFNATRLYYIWWQRSVRTVIAALCQEKKFDLLHHVTFAGYRYITGIWGHGVPSIWGPIGGMESIDWRLLPYRHPLELAVELGRNLSNFIQSTPTAALPARARRSQLTLVSTLETRNCLDEFNLSCTLMPTVGLDIADIPERAFADTPAQRPLRLLFVGQLIWLKGVDLAVEALATSRTDAILHFIGGGPFRHAIEKLARKLGVEGRVTFSPRIPREQVIRELFGYDVFLFPSLHDSGGFAVLEAMATGMPVICLDCGGPALSVADGCGFRIPVGKRKDVIASLAEKIGVYSADREAVATHGRHARTQVAEHYDWRRKGELMNELYHEVTQNKIISIRK